MVIRKYGHGDVVRIGNALSVEIRMCVRGDYVLRVDRACLSGVRISSELRCGL